MATNGNQNMDNTNTCRILVDTPYYIGMSVYIKTDPEQKEYIVVGILIEPTQLKYLIRHDRTDDYFFEMELSHEKNILKTL